MIPVAVINYISQPITCVRINITSQLHIKVVAKAQIIPPVLQKKALCLRFAIARYNYSRMPAIGKRKKAKRNGQWGWYPFNYQHSGAGNYLVVGYNFKPCSGNVKMRVSFF